MRAAISTGSPTSPPARHVWILEEVTNELAEKAKQQANIHPVEDIEDERVNSDGAVPELGVHRKEVAVKTVTVESAVDEGNLEEDTQPPFPAVCDTDPGGLMDEIKD